LEKSLGINFIKVFSEYKTDYFLNTRINFGGLINYISAGTICIIDTQDIFTEMHINYSLRARSKWLQFFLLGYLESRHFIKSEIAILSKYDTIIAISDSDYFKYYSIPHLRNKLIKVDSLGIKTKENAVSTFLNKEFDCLIISSNFSGSQIGVKWFFNHVAPNLSNQISLCIVGSICDYVLSEKLHNINVNIKLQGIVEEIDPFYEKCKIVTLTMLEATGTSVKGLEALSYGATIVSTKSGVRFGGLSNDVHCIVTDEAKEFALAIENLIKNKERRFKLGNNALEFAKENLSIDSGFKLLDMCI
jgi:glycosyltransferase involved in cell wall biosynthesis